MTNGGLGFEREARFSMIDLGMMMMPPSGLYAEMGRARDIFAALSGTFSLPSVRSWLMAFARGKGGLSKKVWRRKIRRRLWS